MKFKITCRPRIRNSVAQKFISSSLAAGLLLNSTSISSASILSDDGRYETFEGNNIAIPDILEEDRVDVEIEGNTMVNVANQKDPVPITKSYTVEETNHIPLQGEYNGKTRPVIEGNTIYYNNDTGEYSNIFIEGANLSLKSSFEDQLVTQEMVDSGQEKAENLGKYKVEYKVTGKNKLSGAISLDNDGFKLDNLIDGVKYTIKGDDSITQLKISTSRHSNSLTDDVIFDCHTNKWSFIYRNDKDYKLHVWTNSKVNNPNDCEALQIQIEEGSTATEYEPYKESVKTFYLNSPLLEGDTIEDVDGKATHVKRYEKVVLDGSSLYRAVGNSGLGIYRWGLGTKTNYPNIALVKENEIGCYSDRYASVTPIDTWTGKKDGISLNSNGNETFLLYLDKYSDGSNESKTALINELKANPVTIVYKLATPIYETISEESILIDSYTNGHLDLNTNIPINKVDFMSTTTNLNYLYPSTEYTIQFESDNVGKIDTVSLGGETLYSNYTVNQGINRFNITTPSEISSTELILDGIGFNLSNLVVTEATDEEFDYFEGIKSVGQDDENGHKIEVVSNNKNLISQTLVVGDIGTDIGDLRLHIDTHAVTKEFIKCKGDTNYSLSYTPVASSRWFTIFEYDKNFNLIKTNDTFKNFTTDKKTNFLRLKIENKDNINITDLQLEENIIATSYTNQESNIKKIPLSEPLRGLPNGVKDKIIKRNGQWVIERNCVEIYLSTVNSWQSWGDKGTEYYGFYQYIEGLKTVVNEQEVNVLCNSKPSIENIEAIRNSASIGVHAGNGPSNGYIAIGFKRSELTNTTSDGVKEWLSVNPTKVVAQLEVPTYEPLNIDLAASLYEETTHISTNSIIPANLKVIVDRALNRAVEYAELAKTNPTVENISNARYWSNLLKESLKKDQLQSEINSITDIDDLQLERKSASSNLDVYVKSENMLSMSLDTNSVTFNNYSGVEDMEMLNAVNISINSSLPYDLNAYLPSEITNGDKLETLPIDILNIKESSESIYETFDNTTDKIVLKNNCNAGNGLTHDIDLKLISNLAHKADVYKTVIKFEAEQK